MNKYEKMYLKAADKHNASWIDAAIMPLAVELEEYAGDPVEVSGPYGLRAAVTLKVRDTYTTVTPSFANGGFQLFYDTGEQTGRYQPFTLGDLNGYNNISKPLPDTFGEIAEILLRRTARTAEYVHGRITVNPCGNKESLFRLMRENPELPVVPMVDGEIVGDDCGRWLGGWGSCYIGEYIIGDERLHFKEEDDFCEVENTLTDGRLDYVQFEAMSDGEAKSIYADLPWIKAIIVNIDLPE